MAKRGLAALKKQQEANAEREAARNRPKADWFKWPKKVNTATVRFQQELDEESPHYNPDRDIALMEVEHQAPGSEGYKRRASCTFETEGKCYACERHQQNYKEGWSQKQNFYINAVVQFEGETEAKPVVIQRNFNSTFVQGLIQEAEDEKSITDANYRVTRTGTGTQTQWLFKRLKGEPLEDNYEEVFNLEETALRKIPYERQADYYGAVYSGPAASDDNAVEDDPKPDEEDW